MQRHWCQVKWRLSLSKRAKIRPQTSLPTGSKKGLPTNIEVCHMSYWASRRILLWSKVPRAVLEWRVVPWISRRFIRSQVPMNIVKRLRMCDNQETLIQIKMQDCDSLYFWHVGGNPKGCEALSSRVISDEGEKVIFWRPKSVWSPGNPTSTRPCP